MTLIGMNVDLAGSVDPAALRALGCTAARVVLTKDADLRPWLRECQSRGVSVLGVFAHESAAGYASRGEALGDLVARYQGLVRTWQAGNEPDAGWDGAKPIERRRAENPSSWLMPGSEFSELLAAVRVALGPDEYLACGGLCSGRPDWLAAEGVDLGPCDVVGIHAYGAGTPTYPSPYGFSNVADLTSRYRSAARGRPVLVSEWGVNHVELGNRAPDYLAAMLAWARDVSDLVGFFYFALSDRMVAPYGLYDADLRPRASAGAFARATGGAVVPGDHLAWQPLPSRPPRFVLGFAKWAALEPELVGVAVPEDPREWGAVAGLSQQRTSTGLLTWADLAGSGPSLTFYRLADGSRWLWREDWPASKRVVA